MKKDIFYVVIQFVLFALYLIDWNFISFKIPTLVYYVMIFFTFVGAIVILLGILHLNDNLTPLPSPKKDAVLISSGVYTYLRHPIYSGIILSLFAYAIASASVSRLLMSGLLLVVFYFKSEYEEQLLVARYEQYKTYRLTTGRFFPKKIT